MIFLVDNDIILKFACLGLAFFFASWVNEKADKAYYLATFLFQLQRSPKWHKRYSATALQSAQQTIAGWAELNVPADQAMLQYLANIPGVDAGEATLYASLACFENAVILTGDKRCLRAISTTTLPAAYLDRISRRSFCFEQILESIIEKYGFQDVLASVQDFENCDTSFKVIFGSRNQSREQEVRAGLQSYLTQLKSTCVPLLVERL